MLLGLITAFITGIGIDLWLFIVKTTISPNMWVSKLICFGIGLVLIGLGTAIYLQTKFASTPIDHLTLIIRDISKRTILFSRTLVYALFLVLAIIFKGPIGIGTLLTVCLGGMILHFLCLLLNGASYPRKCKLIGEYQCLIKRKEEVKNLFFLENARTSRLH